MQAKKSSSRTICFRSAGDTKTPLVALALSGVLNVILNLFFVVVLNKTVDGVAIATVLANVVSSVVLLRRLLRSELFIHVEFKNLRIDWKILWRILKIGVPAGIQGAVFSLSNIVVQSAINSLGKVTMAASSAAFNVEVMAYYILNSFGQACTTFVGQNYGARKLERARQGVKQALIMSISMTIFLCALLLIFRDQLLTLFTNDSLVIQYGSRFIGMIAPFYFCTCFNQTFAGAMRGIGKAKVPMIVMLSSFVVFRQIFLYVGTKLGGGFVLVSLAYPMGWVVCSIAMYVCYKRSALCHPEKAQFAAADTAKDENVEDAIETADEGIE